MMQQYIQIKENYPDCLLFFRLGDFYEMFLEDAKIASEVLNITLTRRSRGKDGAIPMCGVPYHSVDSYLNKLVREGYKVAICEQLSDPNKSKLVDRDVVRVVTPGTVLSDQSLESKENNYIVGIHMDDNKIGIAVADISTGSFQTTEYDTSSLENTLVNELSKFSPTECVMSPSLYENSDIIKLLKAHKDINIAPYNSWDFLADSYKETLSDHFGEYSTRSSLLEDMKTALRASSGLLGYLKYTQKDRVSHIKKIHRLYTEDHLILDRSSIINLELFSTIREGRKKGSLINYLDKTITPMGGRLLRNWLLKPLKEKKKIEDRYDLVESLMNDFSKSELMRNNLSEIGDLERILSRLATGTGNPKDIASLKTSLFSVEKIKEILSSINTSLSKELHTLISDKAFDLRNEIDKVLVDLPPFDPRSGGLIREGIDKELDLLRSKIGSSKDFILKMEKTEKQRTGISSLKVKYNQVFGYYIEITKSNLLNVPNDYIRKQTLVNAERFVTPELKEHEEVILTAEEKIQKMEFERYQNLVDKVLSYTEVIQDVAYAISYIDCILSFSNLSLEENLVRPSINTEGVIEISEGRHPVVESLLDTGDFIPNDTYLDQSTNQLLLLTGPNMAGKSVYIRQVALIVLMAHMGLFVPAKSANISEVDKLYVRSGASDVISMGLSTFMLEMVETSNILNNATSKSLLIMDEIGRGTSTYDGISIAWAVAEHLVSGNVQPKTLFATHYHELQDLEKKYPNKIRNYQATVDNSENVPVFLHRISPGGANHSFGISVARIAGIPEEVCTKADEVLKELELRSPSRREIFTEEKTPLLSTSVEYEKVLKDLKEMDMNKITPLEALNLLSELKEKINS